MEHLPVTQLEEAPTTLLLGQDGNSPPPKFYIPKRFILIAMCFVGMIICYADRTNFSVAVIPMVNQYGWDKTVEGFVLSGFWYGYAITQVPGGWLSDKYSGKTVLSVAVVLWSLCTVVTPPAAQAGIIPLFISRLLMGMGEGVAFPAIHSMIAKWIPPTERSRAVAIVISACYLGTILPLAAAPSIILSKSLGWPFVFYLFGSLGFFWVIGWHFLCSGAPAHHRTIHPSELQYIQSSLDKTSEELEAEKKLPTPWKSILISPAVWAILINQFCSSYAFYVLLSWLPTYFDEYFGIDMKELSFYGILPYAVQGGVGMVSGWIGDKIIEKGFSVEISRKILQIAGLLIPAVFFTVLAFGRITNQFLGVLLVSLALGGGTLTLAGVSVNHLDIAPRYSGVVFAMGNTMGTVAGIVGTPLSGAIVQITGSWNWVFGTMVIASIIGTISWFFMAKGRVVIH